MTTAPCLDYPGISYSRVFATVDCVGECLLRLRIENSNILTDRAADDSEIEFVIYREHSLSFARRGWLSLESSPWNGGVHAYKQNRDDRHTVTFVFPRHNP